MYVYCITNTLNNKKYIGQTYSRVTKRWKNHISKSKGNSELTIHRAIRKYGNENFNTFKGYGYNSCAGGQNITGYHHSDETKAKISAAVTGAKNGNHGKFGEENPFYGKKHSDETITKLSGKNHHSVGRTISDSTREKLSQAMLRRVDLHNPQPWAWKQVNQIDKKTNKVIKTWESMTAAAKGVNTYVNGISCCCNKKPKYKTAGGFKWEYTLVN